jgi:hypothetical protein
MSDNDKTGGKTIHTLTHPSTRIISKSKSIARPTSTIKSSFIPLSTIKQSSNKPSQVHSIAQSHSIIPIKSSNIKYSSSIIKSISTKDINIDDLNYFENILRDIYGSGDDYYELINAYNKNFNKNLNIHQIFADIDYRKNKFINKMAKKYSKRSDIPPKTIKFIKMSDIKINDDSKYLIHDIDNKDPSLRISQ